MAKRASASSGQSIAHTLYESLSRSGAVIEYFAQFGRAARAVLLS
jgi:hypothetical protein